MRASHGLCCVSRDISGFSVKALKESGFRRPSPVPISPFLYPATRKRPNPGSILGPAHHHYSSLTGKLLYIPRSSHARRIQQQTMAPSAMSDETAPMQLPVHPKWSTINASVLHGPRDLRMVSDRRLLRGLVLHEISSFPSPPLFFGVWSSKVLTCLAPAGIQSPWGARRRRAAN